MAETPQRSALANIVAERHGQTVTALRDWIALPTIAAEKRNAAEGADYMRKLALDAGFQQAKVFRTDGVPGVFARNERLVLLFEGPVGPFAVIFVGALNVGSMATVWHGDVTPRRPRVVTALPLPAEAKRFLARGEEVGRFNMGSTVVLLFGPQLEQLEQIAPGATMRLGQRLGQVGPKPA